MMPAARLSAVIDILAGLERTNQPADQFLREWGRRNRYAGSKDRAAIAERMFDICRHRGSFAWRMQSDGPRTLIIAALLAEGMDEAGITNLFSGEKYMPSTLTAEEIAAIRTLPGDPPQHVAGEFPQWLQPELTHAFGENLLPEMQAMQSRAPIDLRVNTLKATHDEVLSALQAAGYDASSTLYSPFALRLPPGAAGLEKTALFQSGAYEFQDEAAQIAAILSGAKPGSRVLDLAAGAGGKALALAALMNNSGEIVAEDIAANRLAQLGPRAERAGATIISSPASGGGGPRSGGGGDFDLVFVDAPCSGSGTWRRQPEQKWRLTPARLAELHAIQDSMLDAAAARVHRRGTILYATCSVLASENEDRIAAFLARHPAFSIRPARDVWRKAGGAPWKATGEFFKASPHSTATDGFFAAILVRKAAAARSLD